MSATSNMSRIVVVAISFLLCLTPSFAHNVTNNTTTTLTPSTKIYKGCFNKLYAFGDSSTDTGNAQSLGGLTSFSYAYPYGQTFFKETNGRLSDGRLLIDFVAEKFNLPFLPPYTNTTADFSHGANFAVAGSTSLPTEYYVRHRVGRTITWKDLPENFQVQTDWFFKFLHRNICVGKDLGMCEPSFDEALFWVGDMGTADYYRTFGNRVSTDALTKMAVENVCKIVKTLLNSGAKNVMVQGLPPTGCFPLDLSLSPKKDRDELGCARKVNEIIVVHNDLLQLKLKEIEKEYQGVAIMYADYWTAYRTILKEHVKYGFTEPLKACCGEGGRYNFDFHSVCGSGTSVVCPDPSKYVNWDGIHPTEAMFKSLANLFFDGGFCRPAFDQLIRSQKCVSRETRLGNGCDSPNMGNTWEAFTILHFGMVVIRVGNVVGSYFEATMFRDENVVKSHFEAFVMRFGKHFLFFFFLPREIDTPNQS
ncbi:hypothetical protein GIB67_018837 [Kingdonia uniflora]|uniref:Uncharacterized protein n=1 Tax=Kingdonia uniflora TaxID=39325 RepID=A0A7J7NE95_9MAGN|nr:hypothetical protein GIB67_018837 [Kingdonia uniflora]